ncbi:MAG: alpha/beta fold hydrolase [Thermoanaerobaculia bacterium]
MRRALGLTKDDFVLYGQSWGGILAIEYALAHGNELKGLVISNMMSSIPAYNQYARDVLDAGDAAGGAGRDSRARALEGVREPALRGAADRELLPRALPPPASRRMASWRMRGLASLNKKIYIPMQGPSEMGASGKLEKWDRSADLKKIAVPTLVIGAAHDTMDPTHMAWMAKRFPKGRYLFCPRGSHLALYDDQATYMSGLISFLHDLEAGKL